MERSAQSSGVARASSSASMAMCPTGRGTPVVAVRGRGRGGVSGSGGPSNRIYALATRQDQEASPNVITGTLLICSRVMYTLIDPGSTLLFISHWLLGFNNVFLFNSEDVLKMVTSSFRNVPITLNPIF
ncbi:MAG: hypothetical protein Q8830_03295, partial [Candidatus Phytoplasma australasiaticum]|nr:hypothetical protein [Candidatus Phytoplasma australasiaticum]